MPSDFRRKEIPFSQLTRPLSTTESDSTLARHVGMKPQRKRQLSKRYFTDRNQDPRSVFFVHPLPH